MLIKIKKRYKGDEFLYYVRFNDLTFTTVNCRQLCTDKVIKGIVSDDLSKIILEESFHVEGIHGESPKDIFHLTIPKDRRKELKRNRAGDY